MLFSLGFPPQTVAAGVGLVWSAKTWGNTRLHFCQLCGHHSTNENDVARHVRIHPGVKPYNCEECGRSFCQKAHLTRHRISHRKIS
ncbi:unnamed protein product [Darwinula stevensoni]|uniref:C2H2-type domain-containing protein n=1 Tax=Darwinula stevensoni TaxID=69355 RepID=A0A7R9FSA3_9CRUS|nr:unnamed protein product [Darwinula stevensoni]CAG0903108.1 unnamed protein product [Darwinula stevensoni]